jgi:hypothetical protein
VNGWKGGDGRASLARASSPPLPAPACTCVGSRGGMTARRVESEGEGNWKILKDLFLVPLSFPRSESFVNFRPIL